MRERITLVDKDDLVIEQIRGSGPGGQHRNKTQTGIRLTHPESGAKGEATEARSQHQNKVMAFRRLIETPEFKTWMALKLHPEHLKIEVFKGGRWMTIE